jgi:hypothetical protein
MTTDNSMIEYPYIGNEGMYYSYAEQFLEDCKTFELEPLKMYAIQYAEALGLKTEPFWDTVRELIRVKG